MEKPKHIKDVPTEAIIYILEFLRAADLASVSEVDKTIFRKDRIQQAIRYQLQNIYSTSCTGTPLKDSSRRSNSFDSPKLLGPVGRSLSFDSPSGGIIRGGSTRSNIPSANYSEGGSSRPPRPVFDSPSPAGIIGGGGGGSGGGGGGHGYYTPTATLEDSEYQPHILYIREIKCILAALQSPQSITGKGYWISTSWMANAKKYFEALPLPEVVSKKSSTKKGRNIRQRRGSDALPPWPSMTADITCSHRSLALTKGARAKKRLIDGRAWFFLRKFYPDGPQFKSTRVTECSTCLNEDEIATKNINGKREAELRCRRSGYVTGPLEAVALRKSGIPSHLSSAKFSLSPLHISESDWLAMISTEETASNTAAPSISEHTPSEQTQSEQAPSEQTQWEQAPSAAFMIDSSSSSSNPIGSQPLLPGLYNLVPKTWLKSWRQFTKDPTLTALPTLDCTCLLCHTHGHLVIPPHFEEYIVGLKKSLTGGLGAYSGQVFEILSADEWDALQESLKSLSDFSVRFCLDGDSITWNMEVCTACDSLNYAPGGKYHAIGDDCF